uniref:ACT domain-containing protein n=1 Tax=Sphingomonas sp. TaxID=28214 RepID=UPI003B3A2A4F
MTQMPADTSSGNFVLSLACDDRPGLVAQVAGALAANGGNIVDAQQFNDLQTGRFVMRAAVAVTGAPAPPGAALHPPRDTRRTPHGAGW